MSYGFLFLCEFPLAFHVGFKAIGHTVDSQQKETVVLEMVNAKKASLSTFKVRRTLLLYSHDQKVTAHSNSGVALEHQLSMATSCIPRPTVISDFARPSIV